jgi:hypothetical protein
LNIDMFSADDASIAHASVFGPLSALPDYKGMRAAVKLTLPRSGIGRNQPRGGQDANVRYLAARELPLLAQKRLPTVITAECAPG